jgi:hypothetical protein
MVTRAAPCHGADMVDVEPLKSFELTDDERTMLIYGLMDWGGPASDCPESLAIAMGFVNAADLQREVERITATIQAGGALSVRDWTRTLFSTEVIYASELLGTGSGWSTIHGGGDEHWINVLRGLQRKLPRTSRFLGS